MKQTAVYIMANQKNGTLYVGVTSDLVRRVYEHKIGVMDGFSKRYSCKFLVFYELHESIEAAILREKQIKGGSREKKIALIVRRNEDWRDLYGDLF